MNDIPIVLCLNSAYTKPSMMVMYTALIHANKDTRYSFYFVHYDLKSTDIDEINQLGSKYSQCASINFIKIDQIDYDGIPVKGRFGKEICFRLFLPKYLPDLKKVIYLDCDTMVLDDLSELYAIDINDRAYAACSEKRMYQMIWNPIINQVFQTRFRFFKKFNFDILDDDTHYCNSGIMLINNYYWIKNNYLERSLSFIKEHLDDPDFGCMDQDVLNILAWQDNKTINANDTNIKASDSEYSNISDNIIKDSRVYLDWRYNMIIHFPGLNNKTEDDIVVRARHSLFYLNNTNEKIKPKIMHFSDPLKPWIGGNTEYQKLYRQYARDIGWNIKISSKKFIQATVKYTLMIISWVIPYGIIKLFIKNTDKIRSFLKKILPTKLIRAIRKVV